MCFDRATQTACMVLQLAANRIERLAHRLRQLLFGLMIGNQFGSGNGQPHPHRKWSTMMMVMNRRRRHSDFAMADAIVVGIEGGGLFTNLRLDCRQ